MIFRELALYRFKLPLLRVKAKARPGRHRHCQQVKVIDEKLHRWMMNYYRSAISVHGYGYRFLHTRCDRPQYHVVKHSLRAHDQSSRCYLAKYVLHPLSSLSPGLFCLSEAWH